jgi:hypothetical protein
MSLRFGMSLPILLLSSCIFAYGQGSVVDPDPSIESSHLALSSGRDVTVVFVAHSEEKGACAQSPEAVVSEQSPYEFYICAASSPTKTSSQPEYDLRMTVPHHPDAWFHMIITPRNDEEIDDQFVWSSFLLKGLMERSVQLRFPVHPRITATYLNVDKQPTLYIGPLDDPSGSNVSLKSSLQKLNLRVTKIQPTVSRKSLGAITIRDPISSDEPFELPPRQSRDVAISIKPGGWRGILRGVWDTTPD